MQKIINWLWFSLKITLRNKNFYISSILILCVGVSVSLFKVEKETDVIGLLAEDAELINEIQHSVKVHKDTKVYSSEDKLKEDILKGIIGSGFVFDTTPQEYVNGNNSRGIKAYTVPGYAYLEIDKEIIYNAWLKCSADYIISKECEVTFDNNDEHLKDIIINKKNEYLSGDTLFDINIMVSENDTNIEERTVVNPLKGIMALMIFASIFLSYGQNYNGNLCIIEKCLNPFDRILFRFINSMVVGILFGCIAICCLGIYSRNNIFEVIIKMMIFLSVTVVWTNIIGGVIKRQVTLISMTQALLLIQLIVCPVVVDLQNYIFPIKYIRYLFPVTYFLI